MDGGGNLYVGGDTLTPQNGSVWQWQLSGGIWNSLSMVSFTNISNIVALLANGGELYAGGSTSTPTGSIWLWNGNSLNKVGGADIGNAVSISALTMDAQSNLYAGGQIFAPYPTMVGAVWIYK